MCPFDQVIGCKLGIMDIDTAVPLEISMREAVLVISTDVLELGAVNMGGGIS